MSAVVIMTKAPQAGRSKTRLCPPLSSEQAAALAEAALSDTLAAVARCGADRRVVALSGEVGAWLPPGFEVIGQRGDGLDERLAAAFSDVGEPAVIIAMDTPQVTAAQLDDALARLGRHDVVLGPTVDGGYWCVGLADPHLDVTTGVPMSRSDTWDHQVARIAALGLSLAVVDELTDIDEIADAVAVAALIPDSALAACVAAALGGGPASIDASPAG